MQAGFQGPVERLLFPLRAVPRLVSQPFLHDPIYDLAAWLLTSFPGLGSWGPVLEPPVKTIPPSWSAPHLMLALLSTCRTHISYQALTKT